MSPFSYMVVLPFNSQYKLYIQIPLSHSAYVGKIPEFTGGESTVSRPLSSGSLASALGLFGVHKSQTVVSANPLPIQKSLEENQVPDNVGMWKGYSQRTYKRTSIFLEQRSHQPRGGSESHLDWGCCNMGFWGEQRSSQTDKTSQWQGSWAEFSSPQHDHQNCDSGELGRHLGAPLAVNALSQAVQAGAWTWHWAPPSSLHPTHVLASLILDLVPTVALKLFFKITICSDKHILHLSSSMYRHTHNWNKGYK